MPTDSRFNRLPVSEKGLVSICIEGQTITALEGESVAAAVLQAGVRPSRTTPVTDSGRAPFCMMGVCFDCLMEIDGKPNTQACMTEVRDGMVVNIQRGARQVLGDDL